jgi:sugar phosphate isomerase/epimerase
MKISVSLSLFDAPKSAPVLFSGNIHENIPYIKEIGYQGVDLFVKDPDEDVSKEVVKLLRKYDLGVGVVMPAALAGQGLFLSHKDPEVRKEIIKRMRAIMEYASEMGGMVPLGLVRGSAEEGETVDEVMERFTHSVEKLLPYREKYGVDLLVEPINRYEINTLNDCIETCDYIRKTGMPLYMMPDTFHMNIEDVSIHDSFVSCKEYVKHVHFTDSNRGAPGMGHTDMDGILKTLESIGYDGFLCLEALSRPDEKTCALKGIEYFRRVGLAQ